MLKTFAVPSQETVDTWERGFSVTDAELQEMHVFLGFMVDGCRAVGPKFELATQGFLTQLHRAQMMLNARENAKRRVAAFEFLPKSREIRSKPQSKSGIIPD